MKLKEHEIRWGAGFKPFNRVRNWYHSSNDPTGIDVPESYDHYIYLRRPVSLYGTKGVIDIIEETPGSIFNTWIVMARKFRVFFDTPMGEVERESKLKRDENGKWDGTLESVKSPAILRFSFVVNTPAEYARLLCSYADVNLGQDKFLLSFLLNPQAAKINMAQLEQGNPVNITEKNLFNYKKLEGPDGEQKNEGQNDKIVKTPEGDPGRIAFVQLPVDIRRLRKINMTFGRLYGDDTVEYPQTPVKPNLQPIPLFWPKTYSPKVFPESVAML